RGARAQEGRHRGADRGAALAARRARRRVFHGAREASRGACRSAGADRQPVDATMMPIAHARRLVLLPLLAAAASASALTIEYAPDRAPELRACDEQLYRGRRSEAIRCYADLIAGDADAGIKADAARAAGDVDSANNYFRTAVAARPADPTLRTRWGELFLAAHNPNEALTLFREALEINPEYVPAMVGLAKIAARGFEEETRAFAT